VSKGDRASRGGQTSALVWGLAALWFAVFLLSLLRPDLPIGQMNGLFLALFVAVHSSQSYGWKGAGTFALITIVAAFLLEACSIATGFPFGFYVHHLPGPKPLGVPLPVPVSYFVFGWFAWTLARVVVRDDPTNAGPRHRFTTPLVATFILAGYDLAFDPIGASVLDLYTYRHPSGLNGVPLSNFLGWLFTGWVFFQLFALVEARFPPKAAAGRRSYWLPAILIWAAMAAQYPVLFARATDAVVVRGGRSFITSDIYETALILSLFTQVVFALVAAVRLGDARLTSAAESAGSR
jgi:putative membrane protein